MVKTLIVTLMVSDKFRNQFIIKTRAVKTGNPADPNSTHHGLMI